MTLLCYHTVESVVLFPRVWPVCFAIWTDIYAMYLKKTDSTAYSLVQPLWRRCRQVETLTWSGNSELGFILFILLLTMLKLSANTTMTNSEFQPSWLAFKSSLLWISIASILAYTCESLLFRHVWESKADGQFAISEDTWNEPLGRGTEIRLHLREEAGEYLEEAKLKVCALLVSLPVYAF